MIVYPPIQVLQSKECIRKHEKHTQHLIYVTMNFNTVRSVTVLAQDWKPSTLCNQRRYSHKTEDLEHCATRDGSCTRLKTEYIVQSVTVLARDRRPSTLCAQRRDLHKTEDCVQCAKLIWVDLDLSFYTEWMLWFLHVSMKVKISTGGAETYSKEIIFPL